MDKKKRNTKPIPIIIILFAAAVSCVLSIVQQVEFGVFFKRLLITVVVFAIIGLIVRIVLNIVFKPDLDEISEEENKEQASDESTDNLEEYEEQEPVSMEESED